MRILFLIFVLFSFYITSCSNSSNKAKIREVNLAEAEHSELRAFISFWKEFSIKFNSLDTVAVRSITLDSIWLWDDHISSNEFIKRYYVGYSSSDFSGILDTNKVKYSSIGCRPTPSIKEAIKRQYSDASNCEQVLVIKDTLDSIIRGVEFSFLKTTRGYRLFGIKYSSSYWRFDNSVTDTTTIGQ